MLHREEGTGAGRITEVHDDVIFILLLTDSYTYE